MCVNLQNKKKLRCFLEKFTQLTKILHDCRSRRSRQISSLKGYSDYFLAQGGADIWDMHRFEIYFIACWGMFWYNFKKILLNMCVHVHFIFSYSVSVNVHIWHMLRAHYPCLCAMYHQQARTDLHYLDVFEQIRPAHNLVDMGLINYCP